MSNDFQHVASPVLRRILTAEPRHLKHHELEQAFSMTAEALGRDVVAWEVPARDLNARIRAADEANQAIQRKQRTRAHQALRRFWS